MFSGPPLPLPSDLPLNFLLDQVRPPETLGAWTRAPTHRLQIHCPRGGRILVSADLGLLLGRCSRVALREGNEAVVLEASQLIQWRALQVVTATPYLPEIERLKDIFPGANLDSTGFHVPIQCHAPEDLLADCLTHAIPVAGSRIVYCVPPTPRVPAARPAVLNRVPPAQAPTSPHLPPCAQPAGLSPVPLAAPPPRQGS